MALDDILADVAAILYELKRAKLVDGFALIGGMALAVWTQPRATRDVDFSLLINPSSEETVRDILKKISDSFKEQGFLSTLAVGDASDPIPFLLRLSRKDGRADILVAVRGWEKDAVRKATAIQMGTQTVPVALPEYLILFKLSAGGPQDLIDVQELLKSQEVSRKKVDALAAEFRLAAQLKKALAR